MVRWKRRFTASISSAVAVDWENTAMVARKVSAATENAGGEEERRRNGGGCAEGVC